MAGKKSVQISSVFILFPIQQLSRVWSVFRYRDLVIWNVHISFPADSVELFPADVLTCHSSAVVFDVISSTCAFRAKMSRRVCCEKALSLLCFHAVLTERFCIFAIKSSALRGGAAEIICCAFYFSQLPTFLFIQLWVLFVLVRFRFWGPDGLSRGILLTLDASRGTEVCCHPLLKAVPNRAYLNPRYPHTTQTHIPICVKILLNA